MIHEGEENKLNIGFLFKEKERDIVTNDKNEFKGNKANSKCFFTKMYLLLLFVFCSLCVFHFYNIKSNFDGNNVKNIGGIKGHMSKMGENLCSYSDPKEPPFPYCDMNLSTEKRAVDLVKRFTLEEKATLLQNTAQKVESQEFSAYQWWNEALHGIGKSPGVKFESPSKFATSFPQVLHTAQSFNKTLFGLIGREISTEARIFFNLGHAGLTYWTPNINIFRDPRWGRGQETPGEDPKLNGDYAEAFVRNFQEDKNYPNRLKASACCKHFAGYSLEHWGNFERHFFDAKITERDLHETYLPAFEQCVRKGRVSSLMCSYNAINGIPSCANKDLLQGIARKEWGFDGYITGDCHAVESIKTYHHYKGHNETQTVHDTLQAGVDVDCGDFLPKHTVQAVKEGTISEKLVDRSLLNLFKVQIRLGLFDPLSKQPYAKLDNTSLCTPQRLQLSLEAARQGMVLLKNDKNLLPLNQKFYEKKNNEITLAGPFSKSTNDFLGNYEGTPPFIVSIFEGLSKFVKNVVVKKGTKTTINDNIDDNLISEAVEAAKTASQTILACGINQKNEREGVDRTTLLLSINQGKLIRKVASAAVEAGKPPIILILLSGGALDISEHKNNPNVGAILWGGYSSMYAGQAIAETIFGENSPSGRLTQTFYPESFVKNVDMDNMNMYPNNETNYPGRTYRFYNGPVVYPFGYGLSYTSFTYKIFKQENYYHKSQGNIFTFKLKVKNTGNKTAANTVLVFAKPPKELRSAMKKKLVAYVKTPELDSGQEFYPTFKIIENQHLTLFKKHDDIFPQKLNIQNQNYFWAIEFAGAENLLEVLI